MSNLFVDVHVLQDVPPANLNRDDSGSPKSARYGGVDRLRVSSQAWKRAIRRDFNERLDPRTLGRRTRRVGQALTEALTTRGIPEEQAGSLAAALLDQVKIKAGKKDGDSAYLLFYSRPQLAAIADRVFADQDRWSDPSELAKSIDVPQILGEAHSLDVALFGRMVANLSAINVDAACQVAHALATHSSPTQYDYFTAVDDAQEKDEAGAGMIGTIEFGSATLYRYATINVPGLVANMGDREGAVAGVGQFLRSFVTSMPSGKQNTFAAHTRPGLVLVQVRADQPLNLVSAFEQPVRAAHDGYLAPSMKALAAFATDEAVRWGDAPLLSVASYQSGVDLQNTLGESVAVPALIDQVTTFVAGALRHE